MADVAIISSVYDGMNLVAKEYAASQVDENGVLILSELAGAADELNGAMLVNPYDIEGFSDCIREALIMPEKEKRARMKALRMQITENDIYKWISDILHDVLRIASMKHKKCCYLFDHLIEIKAKLKNQKVFLFLDYDGTLAPIADSPDKAFISDDMRSLLARLKEHIPIAIISGRSLQDIKERVGIEDIIYAGNHGAEIWNGGRTVVSQESSVNTDLLKEFLDRLKKALSDFQGVLIEDKGLTGSVHFRQVKVKYLWKLFGKFREIAKDYESTFRITFGKKVFEIRPLNAWNKGDAVSWIIQNISEESIPVYIGDDTTDEDAYSVLKNSGLSISIGVSANADYYIQNQGEVKDFLMMLYEGLNK